MGNLKMPIKSDPFKHQKEAYIFVLTLFDCVEKGKFDFENNFKDVGDVNENIQK